MDTQQRPAHADAPGAPGAPGISAAAPPISHMPTAPQALRRLIPSSAEVDLSYHGADYEMG
jgi:hypothetical protein